MRNRSGWAQEFGSAPDGELAWPLIGLGIRPAKADLWVGLGA